MTVRDRIPVQRYTGNGTTTFYFFDWDMLPESVIEVRLDNVLTTAYERQLVGVIFDVAPAVGVEIMLLRRTPLVQPEDYEFARGFKANKTELTLDRAYMLAAEFDGRVVGAPDIFTEPFQNGVSLKSERGTNAFLPVWTGGIPSVPIDSSIIWAGPEFEVIFHTGGNVLNRLDFFNDGGPLGVSNAHYIQRTPFAQIYLPWLDKDSFAIGEYFMRVRETIEPSSIDPLMPFEIFDRFNNLVDFDVPFDPTNAVLQTATANGIKPSSTFLTVDIDICKSFEGAPDEGWATRRMYMELGFF